MTLFLFYHLYLMSIMISLLYIPTFFLAGVLGSYQMITEWTQGEFRTLSSYELCTVTECMMLCSGNNECQLNGIKQLDNGRLKCFLLKKLDAQGQNNGNSQRKDKRKSVLSTAANKGNIYLIQDIDANTAMGCQSLSALKLSTAKVHSGFGAWSEFGTCSVSCGIGKQTRNRSCNNQLPSNGVNNCSRLGNHTEYRNCTEKPCKELLQLKRPSQSSTFAIKYPASKAIDQEFATNEDCAITARDKSPWWKAELTTAYIITNIKIMPRLQEIYGQVIVSTSLDGYEWRTCKEVGGELMTSNGWVNAICPNGTIGRFVRILQLNRPFLAVCEVEAYGYRGTCADLYKCEWNKRQKDNNIADLANILTRDACAQECCGNTQCIGFDYASHNKLCYLTKTRRAEIPLTDSPGIWQCELNEAINCRIRHYGKKWNQLDYGNEKRSVETSGIACGERCKNTSSCIGSSWWNKDGGCHLATIGAKLISVGIITYSYLCQLKAPGCRLRHDSNIWNPLDFRNESRTIELSADACAVRCENSSDCIGSSWWDKDGGCHLATTGAKLISNGVVTYSYHCGSKDGIWSVSFPADGCHIYKISKNGIVTALNRNNKRSILSTSDDQVNFPSSENWFKVENVIGPETWEYMRLKGDGTLEVHHFCSNGNNQYCNNQYRTLKHYNNNGTGRRLDGKWKVTFTKGDTYIYRFTKEAKTTITITHNNYESLLSLSDINEFPVLKGWLKINNVIGQNTWSYIRLKNDDTLEVHFFCKDKTFCKRHYKGVLNYYGVGIGRRI